MNELLPTIPEMTEDLYAIQMCQAVLPPRFNTSPHVFAISIVNIFRGAQLRFSVTDEAQLHGLKNDSLLDHLESFEESILDQFWKFVQDNRDAVWIHWGMQRGGFGFPALSHRAWYYVIESLTSEIPIEQCFDLQHWIEHSSKERRADELSIELLSHMNQVDTTGLLSPQGIGDAWCYQRFDALVRSNDAEALALATLFRRLKSGQLIFDAQTAAAHGVKVAGVREIPHWHDCKLTFRGQVIKSYRRQKATNQWIILDAFHDADWADSIPIPDHFRDPKTLNSTIYSMNKYLLQNNSFQLSLTPDGAIRWEAIEPNAKRS